MASLRMTMLLGIVLVSGIVSTHAQLSQVLAVAGETLNKAGEAAAMSGQSQVPKNFQRPKNIHSYAQYLKYAGEASGILPIQPEADSPSGAPGPSADSALAPATAMSAMGQPSQADLQSGFGSANYDPSIQDWQKAYKPVDQALNKAFETRITNKNARQVQFELAVAAAPLQMLINDQVIKQGEEAKSFASSLFGGASGLFGGLGGNKGSATDARSISANPLTGTAVTAPTAEAPAPTMVQGSTVVVANPEATTASAPAPAAGTTASAPTAAATATPVAATTATPTAATTGTAGVLPASAQNPLTSLFSFPNFGKRKLLAN